MTESSLGPTPSFERPPVVETVLGVQFDALDISSAHLGAYWGHLGEEWPFVEDAPPLPDQFESFPDEPLWNLTRFKVTQEPACRFKLTNRAKDRMIQVQRSRFHYNWLGLHTGERRDYPRYKIVRSEFDSHFDQFAKYMERVTSSDLDFNQWEVTYVNHIEKDTIWSSPAEWDQIVPLSLAPSTNPSMVELTGFQSTYKYEITSERGRLYAQWQSGTHNDNEVIILKLTARGPATSLSEVHRGLDLGHEAIVRSFKEMTSLTAHEFWREIRDEQ